MIEGSISYFKFCIAIFGSLKDKLIKVEDMMDFLMLVNNYLMNIKNIDGFRRLINKIYINQTIIEKLRATLVSYARKRGEWAVEKRKKDVCHESNPYCQHNFWKKGRARSGSINRLRGDNVVSDLKPYYFKPFAHNEVDLSFKALPIRLHRKFSNTDSKMGSRRDTIIRRSEEYFSFNFDSISPAEDSFSKIEIESKSGLSHIMNLILDDEDISKYDQSPTKMQLYMARTPQKEEKKRFNQNTNDDVESSYRKGIEFHLNKRDILCVRNKHGCYLRKIDWEKDKLRLKTKKRFFKQNMKKLFKYHGVVFEKHINEKKPIKDNSISEKELKPVFQLRRTSFELRRPRRFRSLEISRNTDNSNINKKTTFEEFLDFKNNKKLSKPYTFGSYIDPGHSQNLSIDNFFDDLKQRLEFNDNQFQPSIILTQKES